MSDSRDLTIFEIVDCCCSSQRDKEVNFIKQYQRLHPGTVAYLLDGDRRITSRLNISPEKYPTFFKWVVNKCDNMSLGDCCGYWYVWKDTDTSINDIYNSKRKAPLLSHLEDEWLDETSHE